MRTLQLTGLEPRPLSRQAGEELADCLDTVSTNADWELAGKRAGGMSIYHLRSVSLLYEDGELDECNYAGYEACYLSYNAGKPMVVQYGWDVIVCRTGNDNAMAMRCRCHLRRYSLFTRQDRRWVFNHAGQLPYRKEKVIVDWR